MASPVATVPVTRPLPALPALGTAPQGIVPDAKPGAASFLRVLQDGIAGVNEKLQSAATLQERFAAGDDVDVHQVAIATEEAALALELFVQLASKGTQAVNDLLHNTLQG